MSFNASKNKQINKFKKSITLRYVNMYQHQAQYGSLIMTFWKMCVAYIYKCTTFKGLCDMLQDKLFKISMNYSRPLKRFSNVYQMNTDFPPGESVCCERHSQTLWLWYSVSNMRWLISRYSHDLCQLTWIIWIQLNYLKLNYFQGFSMQWFWEKKAWFYFNDYTSDLRQAQFFGITRNIDTKNGVLQRS